LIVSIRLCSSDWVRAAEAVRQPLEKTQTAVVGKGDIAAWMARASLWDEFVFNRRQRDAAIAAHFCANRGRGSENR
jgi:hypothetical protein